MHQQASYYIHFRLHSTMVEDELRVHLSSIHILSW